MDESMPSSRPISMLPVWSPTSTLRESSLAPLRAVESADIIGAAGVLAAAAERVTGPVEGSKLLETEGYEVLDVFGGINWYTEPAKKAAVNYSASSHHCAVLPPGLGQLVGWELGGRSDDVWDTVATHGHNPKVAAGLEHEALPLPPIGVALGAELIVQGANDPVVLGIDNIHGINIGANEGRGLAPVLEANPH